MTDKLPAIPTKKTRVRISDEMRKCIELMATEGLPVHVAAERANITRDTAVRNMRKAHVLKLFNQRVKDVRDNASQAAYMRINHLSVASANERVKLDASKWVAGVDGISPVQKVQGQYHHSLTFGGFGYPDLEPRGCHAGRRRLSSFFSAKVCNPDRADVRDCRGSVNFETCLRQSRS